MQLSVSSKTIPPYGTQLEGSKTLTLGQSLCKKKFPYKTRSQKPHHWDIKLENITAV